MTTLIRRFVALLGLLCAALGCAASGVAQTYPSHPVRMIVPFAAGGPTDVIARIVAQKLSETWRQQIYTENVPGGGGNTGVAMAARAPADGYTILVVSDFEPVADTPAHFGERIKTEIAKWGKVVHDANIKAD